MNVTSLHVFGNIELIVIPMTCCWIISTPLHAGTGPRLLFKVSSGYFGSPQEAAHRWLRKSLLVICSACFSDVWCLKASVQAGYQTTPSSTSPSFMPLNRKNRAAGSVSKLRTVLTHSRNSKQQQFKSLNIYYYQQVWTRVPRLASNSAVFVFLFHPAIFGMLVSTLQLIAFISRWLQFQISLSPSTAYKVRHEGQWGEIKEFPMTTYVSQEDLPIHLIAESCVTWPFLAEREASKEFILNPGRMMKGKNSFWVLQRDKTNRRDRYRHKW